MSLDAESSKLENASDAEFGVGVVEEDIVSLGVMSKVVRGRI